MAVLTKKRARKSPPAKVQPVTSTVERSYYDPTNGSSLNKKQARDLIKFMQQHGGHLTPHEYLAEASNPKSPLHSHFDWNDERMAHKARLQQARQNITKISLVVVESTGNKITTQAAYNIRVTPSKKRAYVLSTVIANNKTYQEELVTQALADIERWKARYHRILHMIRPEVIKMIKQA